MARTPILAAVLLSFGALQLGAQEQHTWTLTRPDAVAPPGVFADRTVGEGILELSASYHKSDLSGIRFGSDLITLDETFDLFEVAPLSMTSEYLEVRAALGLTDRLTLAARTAFVQRSREQLTAEEFFILDVEGISDTEVHALWRLDGGGGPIRAHLQGGLSFPTGSVDEAADVPGVRTGVLPYDMQTGSGVFGLLPGIAIEAQNEVGTVGAQVMGRLYFGDNDRGWRPGNAVEANGWMAYKASSVVSVSARVRAIGWGAIEGFDPALDPFRDPGELSLSYGGNRVDLPIGLSILIPSGTLEGHRLSFEWVSTIHEELDGPWLAADEGFVISWQAEFGGS